MCLIFAGYKKNRRWKTKMLTESKASVAISMPKKCDNKYVKKRKSALRRRTLSLRKESSWTKKLKLGMFVFWRVTMTTCIDIDQNLHPRPDHTTPEKFENEVSSLKMHQMLKKRRRRRRRRGPRLVKNEFIFYQRNVLLSRSVRFANGPESVLELNMQRRRSIRNGNTNNSVAVVVHVS